MGDNQWIRTWSQLSLLLSAIFHTYFSCFSFTLPQITERNDTCELGRRFRTITCVDNGGEQVDENLCSQSQEGWYLCVSYEDLCQLKPGGESGMRAYTCATRKTHKMGVFWQTASDARDAFRGPKSPYFRNKGVWNSSLVVIRVMFINNVTFIKIILV